MTADVLVVVAHALVASAGTAVVVTYDPARQAVTLSLSGLALTVLFVALRAAGVAESVVRLIIVRDLARGIDHAVAAARVDDTWVVLDNRRMVLTEDRAMERIVPLYAFDETGVKQFTTSVADAQRRPAPAQTAATIPSALWR